MTVMAMARVIAAIPRIGPVAASKQGPVLANARAGDAISKRRAGKQRQRQ